MVRQDEKDYLYFSLVIVNVLPLVFFAIGWIINKTLTGDDFVSLYFGLIIVNLLLLAFFAIRWSFEPMSPIASIASELRVERSYPSAF